MEIIGTFILRCVSLLLPTILSNAWSLKLNKSDLLHTRQISYW